MAVIFGPNGEVVGSTPQASGQPQPDTVSAAVAAIPTFAQRMVNSSMGILNAVTFGIIPAQKVSLNSAPDKIMGERQGWASASINAGAQSLTSTGSKAYAALLQNIVRDLPTSELMIGGIGPVQHVDPATPIDVPNIPHIASNSGGVSFDH